MSSLSEYYKQKKVKDMKRVFGEDANIDERGAVAEFRHFVDEDHVTIITNNIKVVGSWEKGYSYVLLVDNNKAVYLKDWNLIKCHNYNNNGLGDAYAVRLDRKYFKAYTFRNNFEDFDFDKEETFDDMVALAKEQDANQAKTIEEFHRADIWVCHHSK